MGWQVHQMDAKISFLNRVIEEKESIKKPEGFDVENRESHVCRMHRALYGLMQASRAWIKRIDSYLR